MQALKNRIQSNRLVQSTIKVASERGRALAVVVLLALCALMLLSDWPVWWPRLPKPVATAVNAVTESYRDGRHFLFDRYQRESPRQVHYSRSQWLQSMKKVWPSSGSGPGHGTGWPP